ncbi:4-hydroxy-3-methylbut-2-enyl diphosphate reductase [Pseudonocardia endophytica]|uniref:4-hydroxy-3-methylbut-2-enyl diphosphate reductase n=1 Tax=Pseudonocardia endophytica TaxID=401976 RepID=A0A4R1HEH9_PSEEN|nr:4-hydroxy-3-methylbut-2-enyl diphosphate reductase [Pseudonocardia endophytica]TCK20507.1 4-hydroxy-3-methylbut-2-enyl diphosphate reductase [Pseudonocardia endophytica]
MTAPVALTPLRVERRALLGRLGPVAPRRTGSGFVRSVLTAARVGADGPRPVLVAGLAGALTDGIEPGDVVVADAVRGGPGVTGSPAPSTTPVPGAAPLAAALRALGLRVHVGPVLSVPSPVDGARRAALAAADPAALAVDTESAWLAAAAAGGPLAVVRVVVDTPDRPLLRPGTVARGIAALRVLRRSAPALRSWLDAVHHTHPPREITLAEPRSFCAGVERAVETVERALERHGAPVYVRRQIVHNAHVVADLRRRGAVFVDEVSDAPPGAVVVLAAHGVAPAVREQAAARDLRVIDATCPLVAKVHAEVRRHVARGDTVLLIGHADHEEVEGTVGEAPDDVIVVDGPDEAATVAPPDPARVAYAMQTTLAVDEAARTTDVLRGRFGSIGGPRREDVCYATTNRQQAVRAVASGADLVLVLGSSNSSNSRRLAEVAAREGAAAHLIDDAGEIDLRWLRGARRIGVTAGASAPDSLVDDVVSVLSALGPVTVGTAAAVTEDVSFALPKEVI